MTLHNLWPLLIPAAFAVLLVWMLVRQGKIDRAHREMLARIDADIAEGGRRVATAVTLVKEHFGGALKLPGKLVEIRDRSVVCEEGGERFVVLLEDMELPEWAPPEPPVRPRIDPPQAPGLPSWLKVKP